MDDGAIVYIENIGIRFGPKALLDRIAKGEMVDPTLIYFRSVPRFETGAENYRWLMENLSSASARGIPTASRSTCIRCCDGPAFLTLPCPGEGEDLAC
jgi:hypothetical protein